jgi:hypothetical protein
MRHYEYTNYGVAIDVLGCDVEWYVDDPVLVTLPGGEPTKIGNLPWTNYPDDTPDDEMDANLDMLAGFVCEHLKTQHPEYVHKHRSEFVNRIRNRNPTTTTTGEQQ